MPIVVKGDVSMLLKHFSPTNVTNGVAFTQNFARSLLISIARRLLLESRGTRFKEGVLNQADYGVPGAGLWIAQFAGYSNHGCNIAARRVLQNPGKAADNPLVELANNTFILILAPIVHVIL